MYLICTRNLLGGEIAKNDNDARFNYLVLRRPTHPYVTLEERNIGNVEEGIGKEQ